jgi:Na+-transporting NADH:ubiquinone oxidoreductase subunit C
MAINKESSAFTFGFSIIMVIVVATLLSVAAMGLKPYQAENMKQEKMTDILKSIGVISSMEEASKNFDMYVKERVIIDSKGEIVSELRGEIDRLNANDAFNVDIKNEFRSLSEDKRSYPLFICEKDNNTFYVIPVVGKGLWGPIWGYIALQDDLVTVYGASFDHKTETPGLGAEINQEQFYGQFRGKKIQSESGEFTSVKVIKGKSGNNPHQVDGITGGTITSTGVSEMIERTLKTYTPYFNNLKAS